MKRVDTIKFLNCKIETINLYLKYNKNTINSQEKRDGMQNQRNEKIKHTNNKMEIKYSLFCR